MKRNLKWILPAGIVLLVLICILPLPVKISMVQDAVIWDGGDETADNYFVGDTGEAATEETAAETENVTAEEDSASEIGQTVSDGSAGDASAAGSSTPDFTTNCIRIYTAADDFASVTEITDTGEIAEIVTAIDVSSWEEATLETELAEEPYYYIDFGTGTVISLAAGTGYGSVGTAFYTSYDAAGNLTAFALENAVGPYYFHDDLYTVISELMSG